MPATAESETVTNLTPTRAPDNVSGLASVARAIRKPQLLAPAGDWDCVKAAVENGADAVYFGLPRFNARLRAENFSEADLPGLMEFLHRRGVKGYVTFNTLVFSDELSQAEEYLRSIISAGVDAVIVQDVGICRLIRALSSDFPIHASTQMTITTLAGLQFARQLGCEQVVLARECSLKEIQTIQSGQKSVTASHPATPSPPMPLEVFVHGALCVAYSGQCLTSESLGGRSANRGECAQACRMPYDLISDGAQVPLGARKYLLSPQDLAGLELLPQLVASGIHTFKIEGRLKSPEYVANITRIYRRALDDCLAGGDRAADESSGKADSGRQPPPAAPWTVSGETRYEMEMSFSRGLFTGWLQGIDNQRLVHGKFAKKRGVYLGEVKALRRGKVGVELSAPVRPGDGVLFDHGQPESDEQGGRIYRVEQTNDLAWLEFGRGDLNLQFVKVGDTVWKTSDPRLDRRLRKSFETRDPAFRRALVFRVSGHVGAPLTVTARDEDGNVVEAASRMTLARAEQHPLHHRILEEQLGRLGGTEFYLAQLQSALEGDVILPLSELNRLRREILTSLRIRRSQPKRWRLLSPDAGGLKALLSAEPFKKTTPCKEAAELIVLVRSLPQLDAVLDCGIKTVYCEFEDIKKYRDAVARFRQRNGAGPGGAARGAPGIFLAPPRVFKTGEEWILKQTRSAEADGYLARNYDHLVSFAQERCIGDFSLNIANQLSAEYFKNCYGLERLTVSYDLNLLQVQALLASAPPDWFEITIHQHMPMFHMEHCVFCAFLSSGTDYTNCGRPCDTHAIELRDRVGASHPVKADAGCRNTVFNARAQTGAEYFFHLYSLGLRKFRLEFLRESPEAIRRTIVQYQQLAAGEITGRELWHNLKLINRLGVTRGAMDRTET